MKLFWLLLLLLFTGVSCQHQSDKPSPLSAINAYLQLHADSLQYHVNSMVAATEREDLSKIQNQFEAARAHYKRIEALVEYHFPGVCKAINGPAIDKVEEYDDKVVEATGFQVIEELIYPTINDASSEELLAELKILSSTLIRLSQLIQTNRLSDQNVFEAARLELLRISSLGISGFDSPVALNSLREARAALQGVRDVLAFYYGEGHDESKWASLDRAFENAIAQLQSAGHFDSFDRLGFISKHMAVLSSLMYDYQKALHITNNTWPTAVNMEKGHFLEKDAFNVSFFTPGMQKEPGKEMITLGKMLFFDPVMSGNGSRSCASCHQPDKAFTDGRSKSIAFDFEGQVVRNAPTLINSAFQKSQFWDQRVQFIEDQVKVVVSNPLEMHGDMKRSAERIAKSPAYRAMFSQVFDVHENEAVSDANILAAIAAYVRSLTALDSRFDQYMRGDSSVLTKAEINGFNLFMGKAKCGTCHFFPLFNGSVPPQYYETEAEVLGVPLSKDTVNATLDVDKGKLFTYNRELHTNAFKTPTVRNASLTAPYMHNGVYETLEEVIDFYNRGGGAGIGISLANQTLPPDALNLTSEEQSDLVEFIHSLTDTAGVSSTPRQLPSFAEPVLVSRKVGGDY